MAKRTRNDRRGPPDDPLWHKDAVIYEVPVRAFHDHDGDGIGDLQGLTHKLDYIQQLGVTAIWLLPFYPSPLKDDGYDIADYRGVHPAYGTIRDFEVLLKEAHRRGLRVITELIVNHTSDRHSWFHRARQAPHGSRLRDFYVWSDTPERYKDTRIIFKDFEHSNWAYDPVAGAYYWHRFYAHQPDLNFDNPAVRRAVRQVMDFWFQMGVDGMRLDAVPYLFERDGTDCENLPETHTFLRELRAHLDRRYPNRIFLGEANQWPEDAAAYFGAGDECHLNFHFPLMPRLFMSIQMEDRFPIIDILKQTPAIPDNCHWALFLRNHDELTLEMVTDEERDYMYRVYARDPRMRLNLGIRRRLAPLMSNNRRRIELMNALLLSLPGTPVLYYGDEIGMGDNVYLGDRDGVRTPMQWSSDRNAGFSRANPQSLYLPVIIDPEYHYESINVEAQINNPHSLLWWMKRVIALRKRFRALGRGGIEFLYPENRKVLAFIRRHEEESVLVLANLSRFVQYVSLDVPAHRGLAPVELFGRVEFPAFTEAPYLFTLGPYSFYWFALRKPAMAEVMPEAGPPTLVAQRSWEQVLEGRARKSLEEILPVYVRDRRWFGGKARRLDSVTISDALLFSSDGRRAFLLVLDVGYADAEAESYLLPLAFTTGPEADAVARDYPHAVIARLRVEGRDGGEEGLLIDGAHDPTFARSLLQVIEGRRALRGSHGEGLGVRTRRFRETAGRLGEVLEPRVGRAEQTNTSILYGDRMILKLYRRLEEGLHPDVEISEHLSERAQFAYTPPVAGHIEYRRRRRQPTALALLCGYVANEGDAWQFTVDQVDHFLERAGSRYATVEEIPLPDAGLLPLSLMEMPPLVRETIGPYIESARLLGLRTGEMHLALASESGNPEFRPEPFSPLHRRSLYQSMRNLTGSVMQVLRGRVGSLPEPTREEAKSILALEPEILDWFRKHLGPSLKAVRIRTHGDLHLGQVLYTGRDFIFIDFEGEPARPLEERRIKRSPLRDVAGMLRSFHYAAYTALVTRAERRLSSPDEARILADWTRMWHRWVSATYLAAYFESVGGSFLFAGESTEGLRDLLNVYRLEKAIYELGYELNNRPAWARIPVSGILQIWQEVAPR